MKKSYKVKRGRCLTVITGLTVHVDTLQWFFIYLDDRSGNLTKQMDFRKNKKKKMGTKVRYMEAD